MSVQEIVTCPECKKPVGFTKEVEAQIPNLQLGEKIPVYCWDCKIAYWMIQQSKRPLVYTVVFRGHCKE